MPDLDRQAAQERARAFMDACHESAQYGSAPEPVKRAYEFARDVLAYEAALARAEQERDDAYEAAREACEELAGDAYLVGIEYLTLETFYQSVNETRNRLEAKADLARVEQERDEANRWRARAAIAAAADYERQAREAKERLGETEAARDEFARKFTLAQEDVRLAGRDVKKAEAYSDLLLARAEAAEARLQLLEPVADAARAALAGIRRRLDGDAAVSGPHDEDLDLSEQRLAAALARLDTAETGDAT